MHEHTENCCCGENVGITVTISEADFENLMPEIQKKLVECLDKIKSPELKQFCRDVLKAHGKPDRIAYAISLFDVLEEYLVKRKMYNPLFPTKQTDTSFAAVLLHNVFFDPQDPDAAKNWIQVYELRKKTSELAYEITEGNPQDYGSIEYLYQIVEAQLGEDMPVVGSRPVNGQVTYIVWEVIWFFYQFLVQDDD